MVPRNISSEEVIVCIDKAKIYDFRTVKTRQYVRGTPRVAFYLQGCV